jgi:hypothetical protein
MYLGKSINYLLDLFHFSKRLFTINLIKGQVLTDIQIIIHLINGSYYFYPNRFR